MRAVFLIGQNSFRELDWELCQKVKQGEKYFTKYILLFNCIAEYLAEEREEIKVSTPERELLFSWEKLDSEKMLDCHF